MVIVMAIDIMLLNSIPFIFYLTKKINQTVYQETILSPLMVSH